MAVNKQKLIELGLKHKFLNYIDHETPRNYFPHDMGAWLDEREEFVTAADAYELYNLLCDIYAEVGIV